MYCAQNYVRPASLEEAWNLNQKKANRIVAGNMWLRLSSQSFGTLIDLSALELDKIEEKPDCFVIGAMVTLRQLELSPALAETFAGAFRESVRNIVGTQFRNTATVGGSIWGRFGFSDILTLFLSLDTEVCLHKAGNVPLSDFINLPPDRDILTHIIIKKNTWKVAYQALRNQATDFPVITCSLAQTADGYRLAIGARPARAVLYKAPLLSTDEAFAEFLDKTINNTVFGTNLRASAEYRRAMATVLSGQLWAQLSRREAH